VILNLSETPRERNGDWTGLYAHVVGDKIYYRLDSPSCISYAIKNPESGLYEKPPQNAVLSNSLAVQNFRVFKDTNPNTASDSRYKAIGGYHTGRGHAALRGCGISQGAPIHDVRSPCWPLEERWVFGDQFHHPYHANGFYIFKSADGINWELFHNKPVLSNLTKCEESILGSDNMPSIFYDENIEEYVVYLRCNVKLGVRHVFYTKSKDLITWDTPKLIKKSPDFDFTNENLYYMGAYPVPSSKKYISFTHHFRNEILSADGSNRRYFDKKTLVMTSENGVDWNVAGSLFSQDSQEVKESRASGDMQSLRTHLGPPHVVSFEEEGEEYILYVMEGLKSPNTNLVKYALPKEQFKDMEL